MQKIQSQTRTVDIRNGRSLDARVKIMIAVFTGSERENWMHPNLAWWLVQVIDSERYRIILSPIHDVTPKSAGRNMGIEMARKQNVDYLMMIENDVAPDPELIKIFNDLDTRHDVISPIVYRYHAGHGTIPDIGQRREITGTEIETLCSGVPADDPECETKRESLRKELLRIPQFKPYELGITDKIFPVTGHVCEGVMILHYRAFNGKQPIFQDITDNLGQVLVKDYQAFCAKHADKGGNLWVDPRFICGSYGTLDLAQLNFVTASLVSHAKKLGENQAHQAAQDIAKELGVTVIRESPPEKSADM